MKMKLIFLLVVTGSLLGSGINNWVFGKETAFPTKPIEFYCPWGPGGAVSNAGRVVAKTLSEIIKNPVVVIHKTGGGGSVAASYVAKSKPDGYTLLISNTASNGIIPSIRMVEYKNADFEHLGLYLTQGLGLAVRSDAPWRTLKELVADAKKEPGKLKFSSSGIGTSSHFGVELLKIAAGGLKIGHVAFKSGPEGVAALLGDHVHMTFMYVVDLKGSLEAGTLRMLATGTEERMEDYPNIPTFAESGYPEVKIVSWHGLSAPIGLAKNVSDKLKDAIYKTIKHPDAKKGLRQLGYFPTFKGSEEYTEFIKEEEKKYQMIAKEAGIKID